MALIILQPHDSHKNQFNYQLSLTIGALGVVFGDIGTSPLYAIRECFTGHHSVALNPENIFGILSLVFWSLIVVVTIKYLFFVMKADNKSEGGVLALMALVQKCFPAAGSKSSIFLILMGLFGSALLYGDGMITPAISVLSAVEGLKIAAPEMERFIIPMTIAILCLLFYFQKKGTAKIGMIFGPIIFIWFFTIGILGIKGILINPSIFHAIHPIHAIYFFQNNAWHGFVTLGAVFLAVTGGEALYADMGHFGLKPIKMGWLLIVLPNLILNYLGQGALLLTDPTAIENPFYHLTPEWALYPMIAIATLATVIASQALISGTFSLTRQAVQLGYLPRMEIQHTSESEIGQIYVPVINWLLLGCAIFLVMYFKTSSNMASAYGLAVTATMCITTTLIYFVARHIWKWRFITSFLLVSFFLTIDFSFFAANSIKIMEGGWFPLLIGFSILALMTTWRKGRFILANFLKAKSMPLEKFKEMIDENPPHRVSGTAIFMTSTLEGIPPSLAHNLRHNKILHQKVVLVMVATKDVPHVSRTDRFNVIELGNGLYQMIVYYGFMDSPNIPAVLMGANVSGLDFKLKEVTYFLGRETIISTTRPGMAPWRERLFSFMSKNAQRATNFFKIPSNQVVEIGIQVEI